MQPQKRPWKNLYSINKPQIQKIKILQRQIGLDDDVYREMLWNVAQVRSCTELKGPKIDLVIKHLEKCAGQNRPGTGDRRRGKKLPAAPVSRPRSPVLEPMATDDQLGMIRALWAEVSRAPAFKREQALRVFLEKRFKVSSLEWLTLEKAQLVIEGLKVMAAREEKKKANGQVTAK